MSDSDTFWEWSLQRWDESTFRDACLHWQQLGGEVNLLLFAIWQGERGLQWDEAYVMQLLSQSRYWREELLQPVRTLRAAIKTEPGPGPEYEQAKALELQLERRFQAKLCAMTPGAAGAEDRWPVRRNIELLGRCSGVSPQLSDAAWLEALQLSR